ncbi:FAD binding domain-containing protein [Roridomyces roridus]|uniref:FAD binding domain-containing protein n=1 Tax=Roridomyces roridus TaxID=1738132 RepID=A0AAD7BX48_9AGAR|nr:FAD binding domain-containing protein [Roridomyces roridus]
MQNPSVLIVGAGPAGLVLALTLLQSGVSVRIIDKEPTHRIGSKGAGIQPRTLELYAALGVVDDILAASIPILPTAMYEYGNAVPKAEIVLMKQYAPTPDTPYPNSAALGQHKHEEILRAHLAAHSCTVELGTELQSFEQSADHVVAHLIHTAADGTQTEERPTFAWLVGTDGARSVVRKQLGFSFLGETRKEDPVVLGDIVIKEGLDVDHWHMWRVDSKMLLLRPDDVARKSFAYMYNGGNSGEDGTLTRDQFVHEFSAFTGRTDVHFGETSWESAYRANIRMVNALRDRRVFIAGDAAHCHPPSGGQGLNSSVQDSANLGWKLALVIKELAPSSLLDTYAEERLRIIAHMLGLTSARYHEARDSKQNKFQHGDALRMLGVNYCGSSILVGSGADDVADPYEGLAPGARVCAGYRAPDASGMRAAGSTKSLFEIFHASIHTVLVFGEKSEAVQNFLKSLPVGMAQSVGVLPRGLAPSDETDLEDSEGHAFTGYGLNPKEMTVVVVRPDTVVGVVALDVEDLEKYFRGILNFAL